MPRNPSHVRLRDGKVLVTACADLNSGWAITGLDVLPFPDEDEHPGAGAFVRAKLRQGILVEASEDEYNEVHPKVEGKVATAAEKKPPHQEQDLRTQSEVARRKLEKGRAKAAKKSGEAPESSQETPKG